MSNLWSKICILSRFEPLSDKALELVRGAIRCSGDIPLDIIIPHSGWDQLADALLKESHRWRSIDFGLDPPTAPQLRALKGKIPHLECLALDCKEVDVAYLGAISEAFRDAPAIRRLACSTNIFAAEFPWHHLVEVGLSPFTAGPPPPSSMDLVLKVMLLPSLRVLYLPEIVPPTRCEVRNPGIQKLRYEARMFGRHGLWLQFLDLPSLTTAEIHGEYLDAFTQLVHRSACPLTCLHVPFFSIRTPRAHDALESLLLATPQLSTLCL
ncbi:hypothetical protein CYLTODRAFT_426763 [Cylindrobasidium torrendii FP15055 ss-10]|uniref:F-box domain-containing protein n=1 Tax=Cylindrobasidium torrendii FP15055 ss-10 TaxID=1314674 RepID=A0A0D7AXN9_9AGAR|nr:hypothetical protein CYLTODRAFT_426763 [Cylindrobasidium torrendii FP15055 ss-10]